MMRIPKLALCAALLSSCVLPPKDAPRDQAISDSALGLSTATTAPVADGWWHAYQDPQLDRLVEETLAHNPTLAQAMARVREAQAMADTAHAGLLPSVFWLAGQELRYLNPWYHPEREASTAQALAYLDNSPAAQKMAA